MTIAHDMFVSVVGVDVIASCLLGNNINSYHYVSQGKTVIPGVNDGEEFLLTDVITHY